MHLKLILAAAVTIGPLGLAAAPAAARFDDRSAPRFERGHAPRNHGLARRHRQPMLPPEIAYRDPRVPPRAHGRPDFLIHGYLPRPTERPIYNEPPSRFPQN